MNLDRATQLLSKLPVRDRDTGRNVSFVLKGNQIKVKRALQELQDQNLPQWIIILKSRRVGGSAFVDGMAPLYCLANPGVDSLIVAHEFGPSKALFRVPRDICNAINKQFPGMGINVKKKDISFPNESELKISTAGSVSGGRALSLNFLHLSEVARYQGDEPFTALLNTVQYQPGTFLCLESTANGKEGLGEEFYNFWQGAVQGTNQFKPVFLSWLNDEAFTAPEKFALDAPKDDYEKELMKKFGATKSQIAWIRMKLATECNGVVERLLSEFPHCLEENTLVSTDRGIIPIREIVPGDRLGGIRNNTCIGVYPEGIQTTKTLYLESGREIEATNEHLFMVGQELVRTQHLHIGDALTLEPPTLAKDYNDVTWTEFAGVQCRLRIDEDWGRFLGYFMGDGSYYGAQVSICCARKDQDVVEDVQRLFVKHLGGGQPRQPSKGATEVRVSRPAFLKLMERLGIRSDPNDKSPERKVCVPPCIFRSPRSVVREFLRGLFEADGCNAWKGHSIKLYSKHKKFVQEVQLLLLSFGITSTIRPVTRQLNHGGKIYSGYWIWLRANESALFHQYIGFIGSRKSVYSKYKIKRRVFPIEYTDKVVDIKENSSFVHDILLDGNHLFGANGIVTHNCAQVAFQLSGTPAFGIDELKIARATVEEPIERGIFELSIGTPIFTPTSRGGVLIWAFPEHKHHYYMGLDAAKGTEHGDFAAFFIWDGETGNCVCRFAERIGPDKISEMAYATALYYNRAMINVELTGGWGEAVMRELRDKYHYAQYIWRGSRDDKTHTKGSQSIGWETTERSRRMIFTSMRKSLLNHECQPKDLALIQQMESASWAMDWKWQVEKGHDDVLFCFTPETLVETPFGLKKISSLEAESFVRTHTGELSRAYAVSMRQVDTELVEVSVLGNSVPIRATENHPFYACRYKWNKRNAELVRKKRRTEEASWKAAGQLQVGDYVLFPKRKNLPRTNLSFEQLWVLGWYLSDGWTHQNVLGSKKKCFAISFALHRKKYKIAQKICDILEKGDPLKERRKPPRIKKIKGTNAILITLNSPYWSDFFKHFMGQLSGEKRISTDLYNCSGLLPLLGAYFSGDGHQEDKLRNAIRVGSKSTVLLHQVRQILIDNGIWGTICRPSHQDINVLNVSAEFIDRFVGVSKFHRVQRKFHKRHVVETEEGFWAPIKKLEWCQYQGSVYNLEVDGDHTYQAYGVAVHNSALLGWIAKEQWHFPHDVGISKSKNLIQSAEPDVQWFDDPLSCSEGVVGLSGHKHLLQLERLNKQHGKPDPLEGI